MSPRLRESLEASFYLYTLISINAFASLLASVLINGISGINRVEIICLCAGAKGIGHAAGPGLTGLVSAGRTGLIANSRVGLVYPGQPHGGTAGNKRGTGKVNGLPAGAAADGGGGGNGQAVLGCAGAVVHR